MIAEELHPTAHRVIFLELLEHFPEKAAEATAIAVCRRLHEAAIDLADGGIPLVDFSQLEGHFVTEDLDDFDDFGDGIMDDDDDDDDDEEDEGYYDDDPYEIWGEDDSFCL